MRGVERRIEDLEQALAPERPILFYQEDRTGQPGQFRRHGGDGRLLSRDQVSADITANNAVGIIIIYESRQPGLAVGMPQIWLPANGRTEEL